MAKRRDLKKAVDYLSGELMMETLLCSLQPKIDKTKLEAIMAHIGSMSAEFRGRIQHPAGSDNKQLVKQYYKKIRQDFDAEVDKIYTELMSLNQERSEN
ncbi:MAG: hypothetical protein LBV74_10710 [Tannerella sp.]|jgi:hypothetical protein|nr:hypothetical protein [Tannerella sp.]